MNRCFYIVRVYRDGRIAMEDMQEGTEEFVRDLIVTTPKYEPGTYLLLEKNAPVIEKVG